MHQIEQHCGNRHDGTKLCASCTDYMPTFRTRKPNLYADPKTLVVVEIVVARTRRIGTTEAMDFATVDRREFGPIFDDSNHHDF